MNSNVRSQMTEFWKEFTNNPGVTDMILDNDTDVLEPQEKAEVLQRMPDVQNKSVLELGAGIGRFTGNIATSAREVLAVDFMDEYIRKNKEVNGHFQNITFMQADVTDLQLDSNRFDVVFSNWLLMYLTDSEVQKMMTHVLTWLKKDGIFFFRESCNHRSGNKMSSTPNPTYYRRPDQYDTWLQDTSVTSCEGIKQHFKILSKKPMESYIRIKNNPNQIILVAQKMNQHPSQGSK